LWASLGVAWNLLGKGGARSTVVGWEGDNTTVSCAPSSATGLGADAREASLAVIGTVWAVSSKVSGVRVIGSPLSDDTISRAGVRVANDVLLEGWAWLTAKTLGSNKEAEDGAKSRTAGLRALSTPADKISISGASIDHGILVVIVSIVRGPLGDDAVLRASLGVTVEGLGQDWARDTIVQSWAHNSTVLGTNATTAGNRASAESDCRVDGIDTSEGLIGVEISPLGDDAVLWAGLSAALDVLGQLWACTSAKLSTDSDVTVDSTSTVATALGAQSGPRDWRVGVLRLRLSVKEGVVRVI